MKKRKWKEMAFSKNERSKENLPTHPLLSPQVRQSEYKIYLTEDRVSENKKCR